MSCVYWDVVMACILLHSFCIEGNDLCEPAIPHINSKTNPPHPIINVVCKYLGQFVVVSFGVASLPTSCNTE